MLGSVLNNIISLSATSEVYSVQHYQYYNNNYIACVYYMMNMFNCNLGGNAAMNLSLNRYMNFKLHESIKQNQFVKHA